MNATDLMEKYDDWDRIAHTEESENYPGLVYIESRSDNMPFALLLDISEDPNLYVWQSLATEDCHAAIMVGAKRE